jgi:hypothetical protein
LRAITRYSIGTGAQIGQRVIARRAGSYSLLFLTFRHAALPLYIDGANHAQRTLTMRPMINKEDSLTRFDPSYTPRSQTRERR